MPIARRRADRAEHRGAVFIEDAAHGLLVADLSHLALPLDRGRRHQRLDAELAQRLGDLFHFGGAALAVVGHALEIVRHDLSPIEAG
jgi:hypothetical protein